MKIKLLTNVCLLLFMSLQTNCEKPSALGSRVKLDSTMISYYLIEELKNHEGSINDKLLDDLIVSIPETERRLFAQKMRKDGHIYIKSFREREVIIIDPSVKDSKGKNYCYVILPGDESTQYIAREELLRLSN
jgi:hypothetical protein